jgi:putative membrane-bound dehydrogenase-like protein
MHRSPRSPRFSVGRPCAVVTVMAATLAATLAAVQAAEPEWQPITVPGPWEQSGLPGTAGYDGHAWYRGWVMPHDECFQENDRDLFRESVGLVIQGLADAHEVFINGRKIASGGGLPPEFASARDMNLRHKVPPGVLEPKMWNEIVIHVFNESGAGGFTTAPPLFVTYFKECRLQGPWQFRLGEAAPAFDGPLAEQPAVAAFDVFKEATTALGEARVFETGPRLPPEESAQKFTTAPDLVFEQLLHEPLVAQPVHFSFDGRGRLWVANYRQYPYPAGVKVLSRDRYYRSVFDKVPPAPPHHDEGRDSVSIHEDTDGDGRYDRHAVFLDGLNMVTSAVRGRGGAWVLNPPYLLFYADADGDDVPDGDPVVHLAGFGLQDTHATANSLTWGPDGWLYGGQGSTTSSRVTRPGLDEPDAAGVAFEGPMVWRYHPQTRCYEIFSEGGGNTWGLEFDAQGRLFSGENAGQTRGFHYVQGATAMLAGGVNPGKFGPSPHPYNFGELKKMPSENPIPRFSHIAAVAEGSALPALYAGDFFCADPLHNKVIAARRLPLGSSFKTADRLDAVTGAEEAFRPVFIANAPDGGLLVADFYDFYIAHGQHYQSQIDNTTGRIYRLRGHDSALERDIDLAAKDSATLVALLSHPNKWHRRMAGQLLGERRDKAVLPRLRDLIAGQAGQTALGALWAHYQIAGLDESLAAVGLGHPYAPVREWTVRLLGDDRRVPDGLAPRLATLAAEDRDAGVRAQLACTARRLPAAQGLPIAAALMRRDEDAADPFLPLLVWWALEAHVETAAAAVVALLDDRAVWGEPLVHDTILPRLMRRFAATGRRADLLVCARLLELAPGKPEAGKLLEGFTEAWRGRALTGLPEELLAALARSGAAPLLLRVRQGDAAALDEALARIGDEQLDLTERLTLIRAVGELESARALPLLKQLALAGDPVVGKAAFAALASFAEPAVAAEAIAALSALDPGVRTSAVAMLAGRVESARALLAAVERGEIAATLVGPEMADRLRLHADEGIRSRAVKLFPPAAGVASAAANAKIERIRRVVTGGNGDAYEGEKIFTARCAACHRLFHKGGDVGPNLTAYQRDNLGTMLTSIVNPSAEIREGYEYQMAVLDDGRSIGGFVVDRDPQIVVMRGLDGENVALRQDEIEELAPVGRSLMPEGLLDDLSDKQILDLFQFLKRAQPITQ